MTAQFCIPQPEDMQTIYTMGYDAWGRGACIEDHLAHCATFEKYKTGRWFALKSDDAPVCALLIHDAPAFNMPENTAGIGTFATLPEQRGNGYGSKLIENVLATLKDEGIAAIFLFSDIDPRFYARFGFRPLPDALQVKEGSVCMMIDLQDAGYPFPGQAPDYF